DGPGGDVLLGAAHVGDGPDRTFQGDTATGGDGCALRDGDVTDGEDRALVGQGRFVASRGVLLEGGVPGVWALVRALGAVRIGVGLLMHVLIVSKPPL